MRRYSSNPIASRVGRFLPKSSKIAIRGMCGRKITMSIRLIVGRNLPCWKLLDGWAFLKRLSDVWSQFRRDEVGIVASCSLVASVVFDIFGKSCLSPLCMKQHLMLSKTAQKDDVIVQLGIVPKIVLFDMSRNGNVELRFTHRFSCLEVTSMRIGSSTP